MYAIEQLYVRSSVMRVRFLRILNIILWTVRIYMYMYNTILESPVWGIGKQIGYVESIIVYAHDAWCCALCHVMWVLTDSIR